MTTLTADSPKKVEAQKRKKGRPCLPPGEAERRARERQLARRLEWKSLRELMKLHRPRP